MKKKTTGILCYIDFSIFGDVGDFVNTVMLLRAYWGVSWQRWQRHQRRASAEVSRGNFNFFDIIIIDNVVIASVTPVVLCLHLQVPRLISQTWPAIEGSKYGGIGFKGVQSFFSFCPSKPPKKNSQKLSGPPSITFFHAELGRTPLLRPLTFGEKKLKSVRHFKHWKIIRNGVARRWRGGFSPLPLLCPKRARRQIDDVQTAAEKACEGFYKELRGWQLSGADMNLDLTPL